ncbi:MAG: hypothetical protein CSA32_02735 [Desulfobulbus propionicus]|nr:MAG: hypothetical protein CSA32_02735 [Desulfobulbus propionicus]
MVSLALSLWLLSVCPDLGKRGWQLQSLCAANRDRLKMVVLGGVMPEQISSFSGRYYFSVSGYVMQLIFHAGKGSLLDRTEQRLQKIVERSVCFPGGTKTTVTNHGVCIWVLFSTSDV